MTYNVYLFGCLLRTFDKKFDEMEYDLQYEELQYRYEKFQKSTFNSVQKGEYDCMMEYLTDKYKSNKTGKRIITITLIRYYSKTNTVEIEVENDLVDDDLVNYLSADEELDNRFENALAEAQLVGEDTTYEWQDPTNQTGGTL